MCYVYAGYYRSYIGSGGAHPQKHAIQKELDKLFFDDML